IASIIFGTFLTGLKAPNNYLSFFGYTAPGFTSADYYPVFPWIGIFMFGIAAGKVLYKAKTSLLRTDLKDNFINFAGRNTLIVYVLHQPIIIGVLKAVQLLSS
ncbi:MAG: heparan-alpha-glucosaminide N-acetyltransferase domain-containing protein, partial [Eubacteriales bacterium]|nr:heparan-alpha-glucosaminide N-acetyltransferase domain-containing protein [Eubacteriales bacterium]